jgi:hypothetical protein
MTVEIIECQQGSAEWFQARLGLPTASMFSAILAKGEGKTRKSYMNKLAAEIVTGELGEVFTAPALERGKVMEDEARAFYSFMKTADPKQVGFVRNGSVGWSPDSLVDDNGALEIKTQRADLLIETILKDTFPSEHVAQCQGGLWVGEREWIDLCVYWPKMPTFIKRAYRDETYIKNLSIEVEKFQSELNELVMRIHAYGSLAA